MIVAFDFAACYLSVHIENFARNFACFAFANSSFIYFKHRGNFSSCSTEEDFFGGVQFASVDGANFCFDTEFILANSIMVRLVMPSKILP